ncbi:hypothetical protein LRP50_10610 [Enterovibrio sp. ZSDZ42]|uniref:Chemotaxis protein n=1 Tax=Enterovibrio gelatinilyticus TaxID=2899819 RepID=A0ABT5QZY2_9GAMM|nr:hypothetical protein [Enterovibrio sp. ZSDZ42]MDD1793579.1 hypothetical protein [Enterovibrio sp. ZSDZ42]
MSNQHKRVNFSIYLDPVNSNSDRYAVGVMRDWVKERKLLVADPSAGVELHHRLHMHKDIYLAGVFLYLLSPKLCEFLASSLAEDTVNVDMLKHQLRLCGYNIDAAPASTGIEPDMLHALKDAVDTTPVLNMLGDITDQLQQIMSSERQRESDDTSMSQLPELDNTLACIQEAMNGLQPVTANMESLIGSVESLKQELAAEMRQLNLKREIAELKTLLTMQNSMIRNLSSGNVVTKVSEEEELEPAGQVLSQKMASVQKLKSKGLF